MAQELTTRDDSSLERSTGSVEELIARSSLITDAMRRAMVKGEHYGTIPGTNKPTLLKPGAEKLGMLFRLRPEYTRTEIRDGDHLTVVSECSIYHIPTGDCLARNVSGTCSTKESRYAWRKGVRKCPKCGAEAIVKSKKYAPDWQCIGGDQGGCWTRFKENDPDITSQVTDRVANPDLPDLWNTIYKMADKRAQVAAMLIATGASDLFTQDIEDVVHVDVEGPAGGRNGGTRPSADESGGVPQARPAPAASQSPAGSTPSAGPQRGSSRRLEAKAEAIVKHERYDPARHDPLIEAYRADGDEAGMGALLASLNVERGSDVE